MASSPPLGVPYDSVAAGKPPTYVTNIPMTALRQVEQGIDDEAMPYRPRDRPTEIAFRQLCCGTCWGLCAWIAGITILVTGTIITAIVLVTVCNNITRDALGERDEKLTRNPTRIRSTR